MFCKEEMKESRLTSSSVSSGFGKVGGAVAAEKEEYKCLKDHPLSKSIASHNYFRCNLCR